MVKVILIRGSLEPLTWEHKERKAALRRAHALSDLHGNAPIDEDTDGQLTIDASTYYKATPKVADT